MKNISFEFFPPKTPEGMLHLDQAAKSLAEFSPNFFSVTYGAGGCTRQGTADVVTMLQQQTTIPVTPHIACIGSTHAEIQEILLGYKTAGIKRLIALRGDLPSGIEQIGEFKYALELVQLIRKTTGDHFNIVVAAYPEFHPQAKNALDDLMQLKKKFDAGANSAITQYFFNPDAYFYFLDKCAQHGIFAPITPGIMPITNFVSLVRFSDICGADIPRWLYKRLENYGDDEQSIKEFGLEVVHLLCERLLVGGAPGLHFYTLNRAEATSSLLNRLENTIVNSQRKQDVLLFDGKNIKNGKNPIQIV